MEIFKNVTSYQTLLEMNTEFPSNAKYSVTLHLLTPSMFYRGPEYIDPFEMRGNPDTESRLVKKVAKRRRGRSLQGLPDRCRFPSRPSAVHRHAASSPPSRSCLRFVQVCSPHSIKLQQLSGPADQPPTNPTTTHHTCLLYCLKTNEKIPVLALRSGSLRICCFAAGSNLKTLGPWHTGRQLHRQLQMCL